MPECLCSSAAWDGKYRKQITAQSVPGAEEHSLSTIYSCPQKTKPNTKEKKKKAQCNITIVGKKNTLTSEEKSYESLRNKWHIVWQKYKHPKKPFLWQITKLFLQLLNSALSISPLHDPKCFKSFFHWNKEAGMESANIQEKCVAQWPENTET